MNALSKLVIFSSLIHQLGFTLFSTLPFAIGMVQDAGLIFLSSMSNRIATIILEDENGTEQAVLSTTIVLLSGGTAALGLVLILMGRFRLAEYVPYHSACRWFQSQNIYPYSFLELTHNKCIHPYSTFHATVPCPIYPCQWLVAT